MRYILTVILINLIGTACAGDQKTDKQYSNTAYTDINAETFNTKFLDSGSDTLLLDVRTLEEFEAGHIPGAFHLNVNDPEFKKRAAALLDSSSTIVVYCRTGVRSVSASEMLALELGFDKVYNLTGGYTEWSETNTGK